jgi:hypothetical protein
MELQNFKKFLPSKKFQKILGSILIVIVVIVILNLIGSGKINITERQKEQAKIQKMTLEDLVNKDTDNDGAPDWEEGLFGTDRNNPISNKDGILDGVFIKNQKEAQGETTKSINQTEQAAQDFFVAVEALKQSGNLTPTALYNITSSISEEILKEQLPETFDFNSVKSVEDTKSSRIKYYSDFKKIHSNAIKKGLGKELGQFIQALGEGNKEQLSNIKTYSDIYKNTAAELKKINTPTELSTSHYLLINHYERISSSLISISNSFVNPAEGMQGIAGYKKWTDESKKELLNIENLLKQYDIL